MNDMPDFGDHRCSQCPKVGHCSLETAARYFGANPSDFDNMKRLFNEVGGQKYFDTVVVNMQTNPRAALLIALATGYALAKGAAVIPTSPDLGNILESLKAMVEEEHNAQN